MKLFNDSFNNCSKVYFTSRLFCVFIQVKNLGNVGREHGKGSVRSGSIVIGNGRWEREGNGNLLLVRYKCSVPNGQVIYYF